jgi:hypothetical protein
LRLVAVAFDTDDPEPVAAFWASILGRDVVRETGRVLLPGDDTQVGLRFVEAATETGGRNRMHLHLPIRMIHQLFKERHERRIAQLTQGEQQRKMRTAALRRDGGADMRDAPLGVIR